MSYLRFSAIVLFTHLLVIGGGSNLGWGAPNSRRSIVVASKNFTESRILAEIIAQFIETQTDIKVRRKHGLGGTLICFSALREGEIDIYAEYTGTGWATILKEKRKVTDPLRVFLEVQDRFRTLYNIEWLLPFGLNNSYGLAMNESRAEALNITRISDLAAHAPQLKAGVSTEFLNRTDGYPGLIQNYGLRFSQVRGMEHGLTYEALNAGEIDLTDVYTTDGKLRRYPLRVLKDDRNFFPPYSAAPIVRRETLEEFPELRLLLNRLAFRLSDERMQNLNNAVESSGHEFAEVAQTFLSEEGFSREASPPKSVGTRREERSFLTTMAQRWRTTLNLTLQHLTLTVLAVGLAIAVSVPMGILLSRVPSLRSVVLGFAGVIQTIPSLALLALMIPIPGLGLSANAAVAALFLYALLPIMRNTYTGISQIDAPLIEAARGLGLTNWQILTHVELPLAVPTIMAGIRTSTIISIGVATLAAFIGAGGLGEPILTGLQLNDSQLILAGAVPAAGLALITDLSLGRIEKYVAPRGLK